MAWDSAKEWMRARRLSGLARYEREHTRVTSTFRDLSPQKVVAGRRMRAWKVPGHAEYDQRAVYERIACDIFNARKDAQQCSTESI